MGTLGKRGRDVDGDENIGVLTLSRIAVKKRVKSLPSCPPEVWKAVLLEGYNIETGSDVWQLAMMIIVLFTTRFPWDKADITDVTFKDFVDWQKRKTTRMPRYFREFSPRALRMFRRLMEIKPTNRYPVTEVRKYLKDRWLINKTFRSSSIYVSMAATESRTMRTNSVCLPLGRHLANQCGEKLFVLTSTYQPSRQG